VGVAHDVRGHDGVRRVAQDALHGVRAGGRLHRGVHVLGRRVLREDGGEVDDGAGGRRDAHRHAVQLALELRQHLAHGAGGAGGRRDDVLGGGAAAAPVLGRHVHEALAVRVRVHGGDPAALDAEGVVEDLGYGSQAVRRAARVRDDLVLGLEVRVVDAQDDHGVDLVLRRDGQDDLLGAGLDVACDLGAVAEHTGGLDHEVDPQVLPGRRFRAAHVGHLDRLPLGLQDVAVEHDVARVRPHDGVVAKQVGETLPVDHVVDGDDLDARSGVQDPEDAPSDAPKPVDCDPHHSTP